MRKICAAIAVAVLGCLFVTGIMAQSAQPPADQTVTTPQPAGQDQMQSQALSPEAEQAIAKKVVHAILMLPYYGVYDNLGFRLARPDRDSGRAGTPPEPEAGCRSGGEED